MCFYTESRMAIPAVTASEMREIDRVAVEDFCLDIIQMMENAGRNLAESVLDMEPAVSLVTVLAGSGGNGGGGLCCARHLRKRGIEVRVILDRPPDALSGAARRQLRTLQMSGMEPERASAALDAIKRGQVTVDALIGYGLVGAPREEASSLIELINRHAHRILSLDVPSGLNATTGEASGAVVRPERTLTLALPKTGLADATIGDLYLADIGIPSAVFAAVEVAYESPFRGRYWVRLHRQ